MKKIMTFFTKLPAILSSPLSIFIYLFLFFYLVIFALFALFIPALQPLAPSETTQLIMGNYTNVLSALGASLAAGTGIAVHTSVRNLHKRHDHLENTIKELHEKIDQLNQTKNKQ